VISQLLTQVLASTIQRDARSVGTKLGNDLGNCRLYSKCETARPGTMLHSYRSETIGSTCDARRAGTYVANHDTALSSTVTETNTTGSHVFTP